MRKVKNFFRRCKKPFAFLLIYLIIALAVFPIFNNSKANYHKEDKLTEKIVEKIGTYDYEMVSNWFKKIIEKN